MNNPDKFSSFYSDSNLGFDLVLVEKGFEQFKPFFRGSKCLELGPATGYMTRLIKDSFDSLTVVEGAKELLEQIPAYENITKVHSLFEDFNPNEKFDTIIMNHVLEHINAPIEILRKIHSWLSEEGIAIIGVPNAKSFHRLAAVEMGLLQSEYELNERDHALGHYRVYDFDTLKKDVQSAGFKVLYEGGIFIKFLSNSQITSLLNQEIVEAYFSLGERFKENCAEIFLVVTK